MSRGKPNGTAAAALGRKAPTMKHRNTPRGGQRNEQRDLLDDDEIGSPVYAPYDTTITEQQARAEHVKNVFRTCPIGWANGQLLTAHSTTASDVIKWLTDMDDAIGKL